MVAVFFNVRKFLIGVPADSVEGLREPRDLGHPLNDPMVKSSPQNLGEFRSLAIDGGVTIATFLQLLDEVINGPLINLLEERSRPKTSPVRWATR